MKIDIFTSHVGYLPGSRKIAVLAGPLARASEFSVRDAGLPTNVPLRGRTVPFPCVWGDFAVADLTELTTPGIYQVLAPEEPAASYPFTIADDVYVKTLKMAFDHFHLQRCGVAVPGYHPVCHLDDGVVWDTHDFRDTAGGWHDAGDLRKWMFTATFYVFCMLELYERLNPGWRSWNRETGDVLDEARWGNDYLLKSQDPATGLVYSDTAGGKNGDNCDNRWTDSIRKSGDERRINLKIQNPTQWWFIAVQARMSRIFSKTDPSYSAHCRAACMRCLKAMGDRPAGESAKDAPAPVAFYELHKLTGQNKYRESALTFGRALVECQNREFDFGQTGIRGFFFENRKHERAYKSWMFTGQPLYSLSLLALEYGDRECADAVRLYVREYAARMAGVSPFGILPYGLYFGPAKENAHTHPLAGALSYRFFKWDEAKLPEKAAVEKETFEHGQSSHLLSHAAAFMLAERLLKDGVAQDLALRQLEWVMGCNPETACLMTGGGVNTPWPHSRFVGIIPGGMLNGFNGGKDDVPFLHNGNSLHWETTEYWGTHAANYIWTLSLLYEGRNVVF
jgi:hypothetical protein